MRRLIFAVGLGISKSTLTIPARPHVGPVYRKNQARLAGFVQQRINAAFDTLFDVLRSKRSMLKAMMALS